jgi:CHAT domain-containing protein
MGEVGIIHQPPRNPTFSKSRVYYPTNCDLDNRRRLKSGLVLQSPPTQTEFLEFLSPRRRTLHSEERFLTALIFSFDFQIFLTMPNEQRQTAYFDLIKSLLFCSQGEEETILQTQPDLVDEGLVMMMLAFAQHITEQTDPEASIIEWLVGFAIELSERFGLKLWENLTSFGETETASQLDFLMSVLTTIVKSQANPQIVYPLFQSNLPYLNTEIIPLLQTWGIANFNTTEKDRQNFTALTIGEFGNLISQFPLGNCAVNLEIAIASYEIILTVVTCNTDPYFWALVQNNLAAAYFKRIWKDKAENVEKSILCCQAVLEVHTQKNFPQKWAGTQNNLANAYIDRILGDIAENIEKSIACYQAALEVYTQKDFPQNWAMIQNNMALAYGNPRQDNRAENIEKSIKCYLAALEVYTQQNFPQDWAGIKNNMATAYNQRIQGNRSENLERSIECYLTALEVYKPQTFPQDWARTQSNLAIAYRYRIQEDKRANLNKSIECCQAALKVYIRIDFPQDWAGTQNNLANTYQAIDLINESIICSQSALEIFTPQLFPFNCLGTARNLGNLAFSIGNWQLAIESYDRAIQAVEISRGWARVENRQDILVDAISVYQNAIQACINHGKIDKAIEYSERARSRQLVDFIATNDLYRDGEIPAEVKTLQAEYESLQQQIYIQQRTETTNDNRQLTPTRDSRAIQQVSEHIQELEAQKQTVWRKIRAVDPQFAEQQQVTPIDLPTIQQLITTESTAILSFYTTDNDTHIFIITRDNQPQIHTCQGEGAGELQQWLWENWLNPYVNARSAWADNMPEILAQLAQRLQLEQLVDKLTDITELIIIPHLYLHQIPFAALPINSLLSEGRRFANGAAEPNPLLGGVPVGRGGFRGGLLGDKFTIRSVPSCQILKYCLDRSPITTPQYGTVENADGTLPGAGFEGKQIANLFQIESDYCLQGRKQATVAAFDNLIDRTDKPVTTLHLANHASSRLDNPLESAVNLADGDISLAKLMMSRYRHLREIFLSCCETHLGSTTITDDLLTLSTGFLCAGASTVIGTLWVVDDLATALFSTFYYLNCHAGFDRAIALKMAQFCLRDLTGDDFKLHHAENLRMHFEAYARANKIDRVELTAEFDRGEVDKATFDRETDRLIKAYRGALDSTKTLDRYCQADKPFSHPFYWAGFTCQGLG